MGSSQVKPGATYKLTQLHTGRQVKEIKAMVKQNNLYVLVPCSYDLHKRLFLKSKKTLCAFAL